MMPFKGRHFPSKIILWTARWYCKYGISYRELQEILAERGMVVVHTIIIGGFSTYAPALELLKSEGRCSPEIKHWQVKYLNNIIECDHSKIKRIIQQHSVLKP